MDSLWQLTDLISVPPGNLVYHLVMSFVLNAMLLLAVNAGRRTGWPPMATRLGLAIAGAWAGRLALITAALLAASGSPIHPEQTLPALERCVDVVSLGLMLGAFVPLAEKAPQAAAVLAIGNSLAGVLACTAWLATQASIPYGLAAASFNASPPDWVWSAWAITGLSLGGLASLVYRRGEWGTVSVAWGLFLAGYLLHLGLGEHTSHTPAWVRLGNLAAYPLLAGTLLRRASEGLLSNTAGGSLVGRPGWAIAPWQAIEACRHVGDTPSLNSALQQAVTAIQVALEAEVTAIGLIPTGQRCLELASAQPAVPDAHSASTLDIDSHPAVQRAVAWQQAVTVLGNEAPDPSVLRAWVGSRSGPLYLHPLVHRRDILGLLIVNFRGVRPDNAVIEQALGFIAAELATTLAKRRQVEHLARNLTQRSTQIEMLRNEIAHLKAQSHQARQAWESERLTYSRQQRTLENALTQAQLEGQMLPSVVRPPAASGDGKPAQLDGSKELPGHSEQLEPSSPTTRYLSHITQSFYQEAHTHLDTITEALQRLANGPEQHALSECFRSAHALRRMATSQNYTVFSYLAASLGEAVRQIRNGQLNLASDLLAISRDTTHVMRALLEDMRAGLAPSLEVSPLLERWAALHSARPSPDMPYPSLSSGQTTCQVRVSLAPECQIKAIRAIVVLAQLRRLGKVIRCQPEEHILRSGRIEAPFTITLVTDAPAADVQALVASIPEIAQVEVEVD